jgi:acyl phosphate:glycerol-3-phosphate acyltransferase
MHAAAFILTAIGGYVLGSIPTGYWVGRLQGVDIRSLGSGNIGATNVMRFLGKPAGIFVLLMDALKGYLACKLVAGLVIGLAGTPDTNMALIREWHSLVGGVAAILGHNYSVWLGFKGGKGIATSAGVLVALVPVALLVCLGVWGLVMAACRYVSLASVAAAAVLPFAVWWSHGSGTLVAVSAFLSIMAIYKHRANIQRLLQGTEHRFGQDRSTTKETTS